MPTDDAHARRSRRRILFVAAFLTVLIGVWLPYLRYQLHHKNFGTVEPNAIYRSGKLSPTALADLHDEHRFKTIIDLGGFDKEPSRDALEQRTAQALGISRYVFPLQGDGTGDPNNYVKALHILADEANHPVLVHCAAGAERTSGCITLYRVIIQHADEDEAYAESFNFHHDPSDGILSAYLDTYSDAIAHAYHTNTKIKDIMSIAPPHPPSPTSASPDTTTSITEEPTDKTSTQTSNIKPSTANNHTTKTETKPTAPQNKPDKPDDSSSQPAPDA